MYCQGLWYSCFNWLHASSHFPPSLFKMYYNIAKNDFPFFGIRPVAHKCCILLSFLLKKKFYLFLWYLFLLFFRRCYKRLTKVLSLCFLGLSILFSSILTHTISLSLSCSHTHTQRRTHNLILIHFKKMLSIDKRCP